MFFVMAYGYHKSPIPILGSDEDDPDNDDVAIFKTREEAREIAENQPLCMATGYEIFEM